MPKFPAATRTSEGLSSAVYSSLVARAKARGGRVFPLHVGDTYLEPPVEARTEALRAAEIEGLHRYTSVHGVPELVAAIRARLSRDSGRAFADEHVQVVMGATSGLSVVVQTLVDPGDEVIILAPFWPLIRGIVASRGAVPVEVPFFDRLAAPGFDPERAIEAAITERTVALYVNSPHNPTGRVLSRELARVMHRVAKRRGLWLLADEAYEDLWYTPERPRGLWAEGEALDRTVAAHTFSKSYGMAGARVGFVHGPAEVMGRIRSVHTFQAYSAPTPMQWAALRALRHGDSWLAEARRAYGEAGRYAAEALGVRPPEGSTFLFFDAAPRFRAGENLLAFLERCVDGGVLLTPGSACGHDYGTWVRLCFTAVPPSDLPTALSALGTGSPPPRG